MDWCTAGVRVLHLFYACAIISYTVSGRLFFSSAYTFLLQYSISWCSFWYAQDTSSLSEQLSDMTVIIDFLVFYLPFTVIFLVSVLL